MSAWTVIERIVVPSNQANITFSNIPQTYTDLILLLSTRQDSTDELNLYPNGSTSNLTYRLLRGNGSNAVSDTVLRIYQPISTDTANTFANVMIYFPNYTSSAAKSISVDGVTENNATTAFQYFDAILWNDTAAITSIELDPSGANNIVTNSSATLYGITKGSSGGVTVS